MSDSPLRRPPIRVAIVDDSASVRAVVRRFFSWTEDVEVVGEAADGQAAVDLVLAEQPDVVLMDLIMPGLDGYGATERIMAVRPTPIIVLSSRANRDQMRIAFECMRRGAVEVVAKPEDTERWKQLADSLPDLVRTVAARPLGGSLPPAQHPREPEPAPRRLRWVAIGASTGGPTALRELIEALPVPFPMTLLIVQHITAGFEAGLADWLNKAFVPDIRLAKDGEMPRPGTVRLAPRDAHLHLEPGGVLRLDRRTPARGGHRPAVDELFSSVARNAPSNAAGVLLTGMGTDGAEGLAELHQAGGLTLAQDEASSVVFGMPRAAIERGVVDLVLSPAEIGRALGRIAVEAPRTRS
ncbi:MAG: chemotaxis-specific protein-glutamate methyltransferase CheB [Thermoanaerobaculia bacterium]|nr:chemotaxis-specific protein-glutamate methyltransferase CheB [Thermoanaerobaculia bacterium]